MPVTMKWEGGSAPPKSQNYGSPPPPLKRFCSHEVEKESARKPKATKNIYTSLKLYEKKY